MLDLSHVPAKKYRRWSQDAINCYNRGGVCRGCPILDIIEGNCYMKAAVMELVRVLGAPPKKNDL